MLTTSAPSRGPYVAAPALTPMAALSQSVAAVVRPRIDKPLRSIAPAPMNPMPAATCAAMRVGSVWEEASRSPKP
jgi:hypothetical protein